ncbi:MAG: DUF1917 domain-containing protein [Methanomicrobiales archaeon]|nr:DUF1917 domain-containing protein [Methanomicrobiales archaeon]
MEETSPEIQADVAYGIFEIFLNKGLKKGGSYLFELVEQGADFQAEFQEVFREFEREYPQLAQALRERVGGEEVLYRMIREGEGVVPTHTTLMYYIIQDAPDVEKGQVDDENAGKWLIFVDRDKVDEAWCIIRDETIAGRLGISAKVSTAKPNPDSRDDRKVIFVYTRDWRDEEDVMRVREQLRALGYEERLGYKRNIETYRGEYSKKGKRVTYYSA